MPRRALVEVAAVALTAALQFLFYDLLPGRGVFILGATIGWATYIAVRVRGRPGSLSEFGLSTGGLAPSALAAGAVLLVGAALCVVVGSRRGPLALNRNMIFAGLLYPAWGLFQQILVQGVAVRNLSRALPSAAVVLIAGLLFGAVHLPHFALAAATAALGSVFTIVFLRWGNVWPLGLCHGWLGVLFYYWVLGRDPWQELVAQI